MLKLRVIPCLDVKDGRVVKGVNFVQLRDAGDPVEQARAYDREGADEITFLDIAASHENRDTILDVVSRTAARVFLPLTVGGGVRSTADMRRLLLAGADKCSMNSAAVARPELVREAAEDDAADGGRWLEIQVDPSGYAARFGGITAFTELVLDAVASAERDLGIGMAVVIAANRTRHPLDARTLARLAAMTASACSSSSSTRSVCATSSSAASVNRTRRPTGSSTGTPTSRSRTSRSTGSPIRTTGSRSGSGAGTTRSARRACRGRCSRRSSPGAARSAAGRCATRSSPTRRGTSAR